MPQPLLLLRTALYQFVVELSESPHAKWKHPSLSIFNAPDSVAPPKRNSSSLPSAAAAAASPAPRRGTGDSPAMAPLSSAHPAAGERGSRTRRSLRRPGDTRTEPPIPDGYHSRFFREQPTSLLSSSWNSWNRRFVLFPKNRGRAQFSQYSGIWLNCPYLPSFSLSSTRQTRDCLILRIPKLCK
jgi:hypothetical protein